MKTDIVDSSIFSTPCMGMIRAARAPRVSGSPQKPGIGAFSVGDFRY
jgi:hypothetical protein